MPNYLGFAALVVPALVGIICLNIWYWRARSSMTIDERRQEDEQAERW